MILAIPMQLPSVANLREHWATKARRNKSQRAAVSLAMKLDRRGLLALHAHLARGLKLSVVLSRVSPRELDDDNLASACKAIRDQVAAELGIDDRSKQVHWRCIQSAGVGLKPLVVITISAAEISDASATPRSNP